MLAPPLSLPWRRPDEQGSLVGRLARAKRNASRGGVTSPREHGWMWRDRQPTPPLRVDPRASLTRLDPSRGGQEIRIETLCRAFAPANVITMTGATKILVASSSSGVSNWNNYKTSGRYHACLQSN